MSGYPYDTGSSFVRYPSYYAHDAFGHVSADDRGIRDACFRTIPHSGTDVSPDVPGDTNALVVSPVFGTIVKTGVDVHAGLFHIIKADGLNEWWIGGHHSRFEKRSGRVARGDLIARMGSSGGAKGVHTHWTVATSLAGALAYLDGWVQYRSGRSVATWARQAIRGTDQRLYGLIDPWPLIEREWAAHVKHLADEKAAAEDRARAEAEAAVREEEEELMGAKEDIIDRIEAMEERIRRESRPRLYERKSTGELLLVRYETGFQRGPWKNEKTMRAALPVDAEHLVSDQEYERRLKVSDEDWSQLLSAGH